MSRLLAVVLSIALLPRRRARPGPDQGQGGSAQAHVLRAHLRGRREGLLQGIRGGPGAGLLPGRGAHRHRARGGSGRGRRHRAHRRAVQHRAPGGEALDRRRQGTRVGGLSAGGHRGAEGAVGLGQGALDQGPQGPDHRRDPARLHLPLPHRQYPGEGRARARRRAHRPAPGHARHGGGAQGQVGGRHPGARSRSRAPPRPRASARCSSGRGISIRGRSPPSSTRSSSPPIARRRWPS